MAGTLLNLGPFQQQRDSMPGPVKSILDTFFPVDDPGMPMGGMAVGAPTSLVGALKPLQGSLARGEELAKELIGRQFSKAPPQARNIRDPLARKLVQFLDKAQPEAVDPAKIAAMSKATGSRPPKLTPYDIPEGFTFSSKGIPPYKGAVKEFSQKGRDPKITALSKIWDQLERPLRMQTQVQKLAKPPLSTLSKDKPALSGRWQTSTKVGNQQKSLDKFYTKKKP
jgi:hypothetical protein